MKMRELIGMGFRPMIGKKGKVSLVMPLLELNPELAVEMGKPQVQAAIRRAHHVLTQEIDESYGAEVPAASTTP